MRYIALPFVLLVVACASTMPDLTPEQRVFAIKSEYDIVLGTVVEYAEQPACTTDIVVACSDPEIVAKALEFAEDTKEGLDEAEAAVRAVEGEGSEAYVSFARAALSRLTAYLIAEGVMS